MITYRIADISIGKSNLDSAYEFEFNGIHFEVQRFGSNFSSMYMKELIRQMRNQVDALAISGLPPVMRIRGKSYVHRQYLEIMGQATSVPLCDGGRLRELATVNAMADHIQSKKINPEEGIFFPVALYNLEVAYSLLENYREHLRYGDFYAALGIPKVVKPSPFVASFAQLALHFANMRDIADQTPEALNPIKRRTLAKSLNGLQDIRYVFGEMSILSLYGDALEFIRGKDVIVTFEQPSLTPHFMRHSPRSIISLFPEKLQLSPYINYSVLDAVLRLTHKKTAPLSLEAWSVLLSESFPIKKETKRFIIGSRPAIQSRVTSQVARAKKLVQNRPAPDFAFVVHALSQEDLFRVPGIRWMENLPTAVKDQFEKLAARGQGFTYGTIQNIISKKNNREINGIIYGLTSTPRMMKSEDPEVTYDKIERLCHHAAGLGAKIMGLGAYTKVVGDSGATINRNSPIPVTTGNSLSASATLWAVYDIAKQMRLLTIDPNSGQMKGIATVIGATGSIGKVSAKLLSMVVEKLIIVAPRMNRLEELKAELKLMSPNCQVIATTQANDWASQTDILVTATSSLDQKVVDVDRLKPGCIVCDCSRPLDFSTEDALKRPDILIIESGEVILPGPVKLTCDIGLPDNAVYACLGETAVLALEGMYEPFTLGRDIDYQKVKQIYKLSIEHGIKLAAIRGHMGIITPREIELTRELALAARR